MMRASCLLLAALAAASSPAFGQSVVPTAGFLSIELRGGGTVTVHHGAAHRVVVREGDAGSRTIRADGERLVIGECRRPCPGGHRIEIDVTTPELTGLAVTDGGTLQVEDGFPPQAAAAASVSDGGTIDMRALAPARVAASVRDGGRIFARPGRELAASISSGGAVTYWGSPRVTSAIDHGGVVVHGDPAFEHGPLARLDRPPGPIPPRAAAQVARPAP